MAGAFSVVGNDEQIFGVNEQMLGQDQSDAVHNEQENAYSQLTDRCGIIGVPQAFCR